MNGPAQSAVALVTGAGRNIGRQIALRLYERGYAIAVNVRSSLDEGRAVVEEIIAGNGDALLCVADVTDDAAVARMVSDI